MLTSGSVPPVPAGALIPRSASCCEISDATRVASSEPSAATPVAPPSVRKNAISELPAPMSLVCTEFWTTSTRFCMTMPTPAPRIAMKTASSTSEVCSSSVPISAQPVVSSAAPSIM